MEEVIESINFEYLVPEHADFTGQLSTTFLSISNPRPRIIIDPISLDDVQVDNEKASISVSGYVVDKIADNGVGRLASLGGSDIDAIKFSVNGNMFYTQPLNRDINYESQNSNYWLQHPYRAKFGPISIEVPISTSTETVLDITTSPNGIGLTGSIEIRLEIGRFVDHISGIDQAGITGLRLEGDNESTEYFPFTVRYRDRVEHENSEIDVLGTTFEVGVKEDGYYYPKGPSKQVYCIVKLNGAFYLTWVDRDGIVRTALISKKSFADAVTVFEKVHNLKGKLVAYQPTGLPIKLVDSLSPPFREYLNNIITFRSHLHEINIITGARPIIPADLGYEIDFLKRTNQREPVKSTIKYLEQAKLPGYFSEGINLYDSIVQSFQDARGIAEVLWLMDHWKLLKELSEWAKVPKEAIISGLFSETQDDNTFTVWAESALTNNTYVRKLQLQITGTGLCNLHYTLPYETVHGFGILEFLEEPATGLGIEEEREKVFTIFSALTRLGNTNRELARIDFQENIQTNDVRSMILYTAVWHSIARQLYVQAPDRLTYNPFVENSQPKWTAQDINVSGDASYQKVSLANIVMMAIEQAYLGFKSPTGGLAPVPVGKVDLRTGKVYGGPPPPALPSFLDLRKLNTGPRNLYGLPYQFATTYFDEVLDRVRNEVVLVEFLAGE
ncbi:MAG: hypothetical protein M5U26_30260 [Planctomycetota bacterium]|nr:hypothetical protein [Planctomycetota bacterium]